MHWIRFQILTAWICVWCCHFASAQLETRWINNGLDNQFSDINNWTAGIPGPQDTAIFDNQLSFKVTLDSTAEINKFLHLGGELVVLGEQKLTVRSDVTIETMCGFSGGATLACLSDLNIGQNASGEMGFSSGSRLDVVGEIALGATRNSMGQLTLIDGSSLNAMRLVVGADGDAIMNVRTGATANCEQLVIANNVDAVGTLNLAFNSSRLDSDEVIVGSSGDGTIELDHNAELIVDGPLVVGNKIDGEGAVVVVGNSSVEADWIVLGFQGDGGLLMGDGVVCCSVVQLGVETGSQGGIAVAENGVFNCNQLDVGIAGTGQLLIRESASVFVAQAMSVNADSEVCFRDSPAGGLLNCGGGLSVLGLIDFADDTGLIVGDVALTQSGRIQATGRGSIDGDLENNGFGITIAPLSEMVVLGDYTGISSIDGGGSLTVQGAVSPGSGDVAIADLDIRLELPASSDLKIQIGGVQAGQFDQIHVGRDLILQGGELSVVMANGYVPTEGDSFVIAEVDGDLAGNFNGLAPNSTFTSDDGFDFQIRYNTTSDQIRIVAMGPTVLLGDVNQDGSVDLFDVAPFVNAIVSGNYSEPADINTDGVVDLFDVSPFVQLLTR